MGVVGAAALQTSTPCEGCAGGISSPGAYAKRESRLRCRPGSVAGHFDKAVKRTKWRIAVNRALGSCNTADERQRVEDSEQQCTRGLRSCGTMPRS
eukprot:4599466-Amphidinium_carterae.1